MEIEEGNAERIIFGIEQSAQRERERRRRRKRDEMQSTHTQVRVKEGHSFGASESEYTVLVGGEGHGVEDVHHLVAYHTPRELQLCTNRKNSEGKQMLITTKSNIGNCISFCDQSQTVTSFNISENYIHTNLENAKVFAVYISNGVALQLDSVDEAIGNHRHVLNAL
jgi:hypothetical protein